MNRRIIIRSPIRNPKKCLLVLSYFKAGKTGIHIGKTCLTIGDLAIIYGGLNKC